jgi:hypothetical protein
LSNEYYIKRRAWRTCFKHVYKQYKDYNTSVGKKVIDDNATGAEANFSLIKVSHVVTSQRVCNFS